jgi:site-specific recombinase XerD
MRSHVIATARFVADVRAVRDTNSGVYRMILRLKLVKPDAENRAVVPTRLANRKYRSREHLTPSEVEKLIDAAKTNRYGHRDATMLLMAFRHGLRSSELCGLEWSQVDFTGAPIRGDEMRALRKLQREAPRSPFVFVNERGTPFSPDGFNWLVKRAGQKAGLPFRAHAHMLRHSTGYKLAGDGHDTRAIQDYLGHRNISNTVRYTELSPTRFKDFWRD